jgi:hypothetical protein
MKRTIQRVVYLHSGDTTYFVGLPAGKRNLRANVALRVRISRDD